jgi:hypothetical protein
LERLGGRGENFVHTVLRLKIWQNDTTYWVT